MTDKEYLEAILREQSFAPDSTELEELRERREEVKELLEDAYGSTPKIREGGSKAKGTMIREAYDLDLTCYFPHDDGSAGETIKEIYESVESTLQAKFHTQRKGCAIRLYGLDGTQPDFHVDVVPGRFVEGEEGDVYLFPSSSDKERLKTNPQVHLVHVRDSGVRDAIKLMKLWRTRKYMSLKTFALELLVIDLLCHRKHSSLPKQLTHVLEEFRDNWNELSVEDPANPTGNDLSELLSLDTRLILASNARETLQRIELSGWESVFGEIAEDTSQRASAVHRVAVIAPPTTRPWYSEW